MTIDYRLHAITEAEVDFMIRTFIYVSFSFMLGQNFPYFGEYLGAFFPPFIFLIFSFVQACVATYIAYGRILKKETR